MGIILDSMYRKEKQISFYKSGQTGRLTANLMQILVSGTNLANVTIHVKAFKNGRFHNRYLQLKQGELGGISNNYGGEGTYER